MVLLRLKTRRIKRRAKHDLLLRAHEMLGRVDTFAERTDVMEYPADSLHFGVTPTDLTNWP